MGECRTSVILQRSKHRIGIDLVTHSCQNAAAIIVAEVITVRRSSTVINDVSSPFSPKSSGLKNSVSNRCRPTVIDATAHARVSPVSAKSAVAHGQHPRFVVDAAAVAAEIGGGGPVTAKSAVG